MVIIKVAQMAATQPQVARRGVARTKQTRIRHVIVQYEGEPNVFYVSQGNRAVSGPFSINDGRFEIVWDDDSEKKD